MKKIRIYVEQGRNNFHNSRPINILIDPKDVVDYEGSRLIRISESQAKRLEKHFCGISGCVCGSGPVVEYDQDKFGISTYFLKD